MTPTPPRGVASGPQGLDWLDLCLRPQTITTLNLLALGLMVSEKKLFEGSLAI